MKKIIIIIIVKKKKLYYNTVFVLQIEREMRVVCIAIQYFCIVIEACAD